MSLRDPAALQTQSFPGCRTERQKPLHDAQHNLSSSGGVELAENAGEIGVNRVLGDTERTGNGVFGVIIENAANNLEFAWRQPARLRNRAPRFLGKHLRPCADRAHSLYPVLPRLLRATPGDFLPSHSCLWNFRQGVQSRLGHEPNPLSTKCNSHHIVDPRNHYCSCSPCT